DERSVAAVYSVTHGYTMQSSLAGRNDRYSAADKDPSTHTWRAGLEWRPLDSLLVRSSYGTGFRAPDMHYLFAGEDYYRTRFATDYYACRSENPGASDNECYDRDFGNYDVSTFDVYAGNQNLDVETSKSFSAGFVFSPLAGLDLSVDYYRIKISNQVQVQDRERLRSTEANGRLGVPDDGDGVDITSPTCVDAMARVIRDADGEITSVRFAPINIANEETSGLDVTANYRFSTATAGNFHLNGSYTWARQHERQLYPGDAYEDMLDVSFSAATLPSNKGNIGLNWDKDAFGASLFGNYLGRVANYANDAWTDSTWRFNASARYDINSHLRVALSVNNLFNKMPPKDATWSNYPYYDTAWFDSRGRNYFVQVTWKLGGAPL